MMTREVLRSHHPTGVIIKCFFCSLAGDGGLYNMWRDNKISVCPQDINTELLLGYSVARDHGIKISCDILVELKTKERPLNWTQRCCKAINYTHRFNGIT